MDVTISRIDPRTSTEWETFVDSHPDATVFHSTAWCNVLAETYGYKPLYVALRDETLKIVGGVPLMVVDSWLTSKRLVGLPFSDLCMPLLPADCDADEVMRAIAGQAGDSGAVALEVRGRPAADMRLCGYTNGTTFYQHVIELREDTNLDAQVHSSARRAIRKAEKEGVTVRLSTDAGDMRKFYELMVLTRRKHGLLPQPWRFFQNIQRYLVDEGSAHLLLAEHGGEVIAGDLLLSFRDQLVYKFNASDPRFLHLRPNNLLLWHAMRFGIENGRRSLDLGRCEEDNEGLRRFKLLWGSREQTLSYFYYPANRSGSSLLSAKPARKALSLFVKYAPSPALQMAGAVLYGNFG